MASLVLSSALGLQTSDRLLVVDGGTLIDGMGQAPVSNARILVRGDHIEAIGTADQVSIPDGAEIVDARGKYVIPGLIDAHVHFRNWHGEMLLHYGITSIFEIGDYTEWLVALKKGVAKGKIGAPRFFISGNMLDSPQEKKDPFSIGAGRVKAVHLYRTPVENAEAARHEVQSLSRQGVDLIKVHQRVTGALLRTVVDASHGLNLPVLAHTNDARDAARAGVDGIAHLWGISATLMTPDNFRAYRNGDIAYPYAWMQRDRMDALVSLLVAEEVFLNPLLVHEHKALTERVREFQRETYNVLQDPDLSYIPLNDRVAIVSMYHRVRNYSLKIGLFPPLQRLNPQLVNEFRRGYANAQEFVRRFVWAGGKLFSGSSGASTNLPGLSLHHELQVLVDTGLSPREALLTATRYPAELLGIDDRIGTLRPGLLADFVILNSNPLDDIANTTDIDAVFKDGLMVDRRFHPDYDIAVTDPLHLVDTPNYPVPALEMISPKMITEGGPALELEIHGNGFTPVSEVLLAGTRLETRFLNTGMLRAHVPAVLVTVAGTRDVTVRNPPPGGGVSNPFGLIVQYR